ncbi:MAG: DUF3817 domain-containing protein [Propionibacteriales bacterium]|nr:DUF3817 domain-containing protein [Propionibacteriales bacterium]
MTKLFSAYRVLSPVVGVLLAFCSLVVLPAKYLATDGSGLQKFGEDASILWVAHGWVYMIYFLVAFLISRQARWTPQYSVLVLVAGLVPLLIFWVERNVIVKLREQFPELASS